MNQHPPVGHTDYYPIENVDSLPSHAYDSHRDDDGPDENRHSNDEGHNIKAVDPILARQSSSPTSSLPLGIQGERVGRGAWDESKKRGGGIREFHRAKCFDTCY
jgi:hypothetical protein